MFSRGFYIHASDVDTGRFDDIILEVEGAKMGLYSQMGHATPKAVYMNQDPDLPMTVIVLPGDSLSNSDTEIITFTTVPLSIVDDVPLFSKSQSGGVNINGTVFRTLSLCRNDDTA